MPHREGYAREGFACAGNWIIDHVRLIDHYPNEEGLAYIREESNCIEHSQGWVINPRMRK